MGLVDGVITEDSDAFLFGAQAVYKNIFSDKKYVEVYLAEDAKREMGLTREDLISLAFFLGSDYTEGVNGVGIVNAMEIIHAFPMKEETGGIISGLHKFKEWLRGYDFASDILTELDLKKKAIESWKESKEGKKVASKGKKTTSKKDKPESDEEEDEVMGDKIREDEIKALFGSDDPDDDENSEEVNLSAQESRLVSFDHS